MQYFILLDEFTLVQVEPPSLVGRCCAIMTPIPPCPDQRSTHVPEKNKSRHEPGCAGRPDVTPDPACHADIHLDRVPVHRDRRPDLSRSRPPDAARARAARDGCQQYHAGLQPGRIFSLDDQTGLSGWLFPAEGTPKSTIILVHDAQANRLQFSLDTPYLYETLVELGYNVLSFDLRHSG